MEENLSRFVRFTSACATAFARVGEWVAGFRFWHFVLISVLALLAAAIVDSVFLEDHTRQRVKVKHGNNHDDSEVRIGKDGIVILRKGKNGSLSPEPSADADKDSVEEISVPERPSRTSLADWMVALLAILWVLRVATRARAKAEVRAERAEAQAENEVLERQLAEARLQTLQAQVEPHFLFNTLAAVEHLIETDPARAATMQRHLIAFLRGALPRMRKQATTLGDELELCRNYLAIMKIRMEDRLDFKVEVADELLGLAFPPLMLQTVVENAVKHGLEPKTEGGSLFISACRAASRLRVTVADSGLGFAAAGSGSAGSGIGLANIRERLFGLFGDAAALTVSPNVPTGAQVSIEVPYGYADGDHRR